MSSTIPSGSKKPESANPDGSSLPPEDPRLGEDRPTPPKVTEAMANSGLHRAIPRRYHGVIRNCCSCSRCTAHCMEQPGFLVPEDLKQLIPLNDNAEAWAKEHLQASLGALLMNQSHVLRIGTLVPKPRALLTDDPYPLASECQDVAGSNRCHWLDEGDRCKVHHDAPFGCAFFCDHEQDQQAEEQARISHYALTRMHVGFPKGNADIKAYSQLWKYLFMHGYHAREPFLSTTMVRLRIVADERKELIDPMFLTYLSPELSHMTDSKIRAWYRILAPTNGAMITEGLLLWGEGQGGNDLAVRKIG